MEDILDHPIERPAPITKIVRGTGHSLAFQSDPFPDDGENRPQIARLICLDMRKDISFGERLELIILRLLENADDAGPIRHVNRQLEVIRGRHDEITSGLHFNLRRVRHSGHMSFRGQKGFDLRAVQLTAQVVQHDNLTTTANRRIKVLIQSSGTAFTLSYRYRRLIVNGSKNFGKKPFPDWLLSASSNIIGDLAFKIPPATRAGVSNAAKALDLSPSDW